MISKQAIVETTEIGKNSVISEFCIIRSDVKIGNNVTVGAGAVVVKDVPDDVVVVGNPARVLMHKEKDAHWFNIDTIKIEEK